MTKTFRAVTTLLVSLLAMPAWAHGPHTHGVAHLAVAIDGPTLTLILTAPAESLVGFERAPRNAREQALIETARTTLSQAETQFKPSAAAQCRLTTAKLASPLFEPATGTMPGHLDVEGSFTFECATPAALKDLRVELFDAFPRLRRLQTEIAAPGGQKAMRLTTRQRVARW